MHVVELCESDFTPGDLTDFGLEATLIDAGANFRALQERILRENSRSSGYLGIFPHGFMQVTVVRLDKSGVQRLDYALRSQVEEEGIVMLKRDDGSVIYYDKEPRPGVTPQKVFDGLRDAVGRIFIVHENDPEVVFKGIPDYHFMVPHYIERRLDGTAYRRKAVYYNGGLPTHTAIEDFNFYSNSFTMIVDPSDRSAHLTSKDTTCGLVDVSNIFYIEMSYYLIPALLDSRIVLEAGGFESPRGIYFVLKDMGIWPCELCQREITRKYDFRKWDVPQ
jgi:hypothetical protein